MTSEGLKFKIFWGSMPPDPPRGVDCPPLSEILDPPLNAIMLKLASRRLVEVKLYIVSQESTVNFQDLCLITVQANHIILTELTRLRTLPFTGIPRKQRGVIQGLSNNFTRFCLTFPTIASEDIIIVCNHSTYDMRSLVPGPSPSPAPYIRGSRSRANILKRGRPYNPGGSGTCTIIIIL